MENLNIERLAATSAKRENEDKSLVLSSKETIHPNLSEPVENSECIINNPKRQSDVKSFHQLGNEKYKNQEYKKALDNYFRIIKYEKQYIIYSNIAACYLCMENYKLALTYGLKSIELNLKYSVGWGRVGSAYKGLEMLNESCTAYTSANSFDKLNINYINEIREIQNQIKESKKIKENNNFPIKNIDLNPNKLFNMCLNDKDLLNKIQDKDFMNTILSIKNPNDVLNNKGIMDVLNEIMTKL